MAVEVATEGEETIKENHHIDYSPFQFKVIC